MHERVKCLRKALNITQQEFADRLAISRSNLGNIETGAVALTDRVIVAICREFRVDEVWLRTGEGEMFRPVRPEEEITAFLGDVISERGTDFKRRFISALAKLDEPAWEAIEAFAQSILDEKEKPD